MENTLNRKFERTVTASFLTMILASAGAAIGLAAIPGSAAAAGTPHAVASGATASVTCAFTPGAGFDTLDPYSSFVWVKSTTASGCPEFHNHTRCVYKGGFTNWENGPTRSGKGSLLSNSSKATCNGDGNVAPNRIDMVYLGSDGKWHDLELWHS